MKKKTLRDLNPKQKALLLNRAVSADLVSLLLHMRSDDIVDIRYRQQFKESINAASRRYRAKIHEKEMKKFKKPYGTRMPWTREEEEKLLQLSSENKTDQEIANILNRSTYSVSKKKERLLKERNNG